MPPLHCCRNAAAALALLALAGAVGGCANVGDSFASSAFVDPAKYDTYNCKQIETDRVNLTAAANAKQALIDKAATGTGGAVIGEMVHRNDYIAFRAQKKLADEAWQSHSCDAVTLPPATPAVAATPAAPPPKPAAVAAPASGTPRGLY